MLTILSKKLVLFMNWSAKMAGKPLTFIFAWVLIILWGIKGFISGFTPSWLLVIDTIATINASLMVFIIQNTQNRENKALHIKIDELIRATEKAETTLIAIEDREEAEIEKIREVLVKKIKKRQPD